MSITTRRMKARFTSQNVHRQINLAQKEELKDMDLRKVKTLRQFCQKVPETDLP